MRQRKTNCDRLRFIWECNIRYKYCMPLGNVSFLLGSKLLSFEKIVEVAAAATDLGVTDFRLTGGEPLMRPRLEELVSELCKLPGVKGCAITTNGMLLAEKVAALANAGLRRVNISLDTLSEPTFRQLSRRSGLHKVLEGIEASLSDSRLQVRLNALLLRKTNLHDLVDLVQFARQRRVTIRFIEFMPLDSDSKWQLQEVVTGAEIRDILSQKLGPINPISQPNSSQPACDYQFADGSQIGFIDSVSQPFCSKCDRLRLTADGKLLNCLFGRNEWDLGPVWEYPNCELSERRTKIGLLISECVSQKTQSHGIGEPGFSSASRTMHQIGG